MRDTFCRAFKSTTRYANPFRSALQIIALNRRFSDNRIDFTNDGGCREMRAVFVLWGEQRVHLLRSELNIVAC